MARRRLRGRLECRAEPARRWPRRFGVLELVAGATRPGQPHGRRGSAAAASMGGTRSTPRSARRLGDRDRARFGLGRGGPSSPPPRLLEVCRSAARSRRPACVTRCRPCLSSAGSRGPPPRSRPPAAVGQKFAALSWIVAQCAQRRCGLGARQLLVQIERALQQPSCRRGADGGSFSASVSRGVPSVGLKRKPRDRAARAHAAAQEAHAPADHRAAESCAPAARSTRPSRRRTRLPRFSLRHQRDASSLSPAGEQVPQAAATAASAR